MTRENIYWIKDKLKRCIEHGWKEERKNAFETKNYCANWNDNNWIGDRAYRSLFIHVPRTGGTSIRNSLEKYSLFPDHHLAKDIKLKQPYKDFFLYTILRDPYERMVSIYEYVFGGFGYLKKLLAFYQAVQESVDLDAKFTASRRWTQVEIILGGHLHDWISQLPTPTKESISFERFVDIITEELWDIMWEPQTSFVFDNNDKIIVDYVGRTETLQEDVDNIIKEINKRNHFLFIEEEIKIPHINKITRPHYKSYYNDEVTKNKVAKYYEKDIDYLKVVF